MIDNQTHNDLLRDLINVRDIAGWNDSELCKELGISHSLWSRIKNKKQRPTVGFLMAVARTFPHLRNKALMVILFPINNFTK